MISPHRIGEMMRNLVEDPKRLPDVPVPACLLQSVNQEKFSCKICEELYTDVDSLISHGLTHQYDASLRCAYCGKDGWPSSASLSLHQMVWQSSGRLCSNCGAGVGPEEKKHCCDSPGGDNRRYECPLSCNKVKYTLEYLKNHLISYHGCVEDDILISQDSDIKVDDVRVKMEEETVGCPSCEAQINQQNISMEDHLLLSCSVRSKSVRERVSLLVRLAKDAGEDPLLVVRQEIDSCLFHLSGLLEHGSYLAELLKSGDTQDQRYPTLPTNFTLDHLAWIPSGCTQATILTDQLHVMIGLWGQVLERLAGPTDLQSTLDRLELELAGDLRDWSCSETSSEICDNPDQILVSKLEDELGWRDSSPASDIGITVRILQDQSQAY